MAEAPEADRQPCSKRTPYATIAGITDDGRTVSYLISQHPTYHGRAVPVFEHHAHPHTYSSHNYMYARMLENTHTRVDTYTGSHTHTPQTLRASLR